MGIIDVGGLAPSFQYERGCSVTEKLGPPVVPLYPFFGGGGDSVPLLKSTNQNKVGTLVPSPLYWST